MIYWADNPAIYQCVTWGLFLLLLALAVGPAFGGRRNPAHPLQAVLERPWIFLAIIPIFLLTARWPGFFYFAAYNVDEAQILAAAQALTVDPVFFRSAECGSSGPFVVYPLLLPVLLGFEATLFSSRVIGVFMLAACCCALYGILRLVFLESVARIATVAAAAFFAFLTYWDFVHYTSEHAPQFYLWIGLFCTARVAFGSQLSVARMVVWAAVGAICFSIVPLAKLQGTYLALFGGLLLLVVVWSATGFLTLRGRLLMLASTGFAALLVPAILIVLFSASGVLDYFFMSYLGNALAYQTSGLQEMTPSRLLVELLAKADESRTFAAGIALFWLVASGALMAPAVRRVSKCACFLSAAACLFFILAVAAVTATLRDYTHYLLFLPFFAVLVSGSLCGLLIERGPLRRSHELTCIGVFILFVIAPVANLRLEKPNHKVGISRAWGEKQNSPHTPVGSALRQLAGDRPARLTIWGYMPDYHIETGLIQATRLSTSAGFQLPPGPLRTFFVKSFLEDFRNNSPEFFVDAVAPGQFLLTDPSIHGHERVPGVKNWIDANYDLVREINGVRIYQRKATPSKPAP